MERYIATNKELSAKGDSALAIVKAFMKSEQAIQKQMVELMGTKVPNKDPVEFKGHCFKCNQEGHKQSNCPNESSGEATRSHVTVGAVDAMHLLFQLQAIPFENQFIDRVSTFFDSGSNVNLVTESFARRARLKGQPELQSLSTTGGKVSEWTMKAYFVPLIERWGKV